MKDINLQKFMEKYIVVDGKKFQPNAIQIELMKLISDKKASRITILRRVTRF